MNNNNEQLSFLSDEKLLDQTRLLVQKERDINFQILRHLEEIEARKLYLSRGFSSLFDYAIKELGYSGSAAQRRIKAMGLCKDMPEIEAKLKSGKLNLTTAVQLQQFFEKTKEQNKEKTKKKNQARFTFKSVGECIETKEIDVKKTEENILDKIQENKELMLQDRHLDKTQKINLIKKVEGKSSREVEKILAQLTNNEIFLKDRIKYVNANKIKMNIVVQEKCLTNLEKLKHLLSHKNPNMSYGNLLFLLSEIALEKYDPQRRYERRLDKKENNLKQQSTNALPSVDDKTVNEKNKCETVCKSNNKAMSESNIFQKQKRKILTMGRYIPVQMRDHIWSRDKGQCTYVCSKTNKKCSSNHLLQIDHIQPFSLGGSHSSKNLRLLCAFHNQYRNHNYNNKNLKSLPRR